MKGFVSQDKPQYRFYRKEPVRKINVQQSMYDLVFVSNRENMNNPAVRCMNGTWTFTQLMEMTDRLADAFVKAGLKRGETVLISLNCGVEAVLCLLAINKVGAVSKWIDLRASEKDAIDYIKASESRIFVAYEPVIPVLGRAAAMPEKLIVVSPVEMLSLTTRLAYRSKNPVPECLKELENSTSVVTFRKFLNSGDPNADIRQLPFDRTRPSVIVQSSGTTGKPKDIVHSDYSATSCARSLAYSDMPVEPGEEVLVTLPPWLAYTIGQGTLWPLACGACVRFEPRFIEPDALYSNIGNFTVTFSAPVLYRYVLNHFNELSNKKKEQLRKVKTFISGGDKISPEENETFDSTFGAPVLNGYGSNECWGCLTVNCTKHNKHGSVGIPKYGETVISYDNEKECELPYGEVGEICGYIDTGFLYYEGNKAETEMVKKVHKDGKTWIHTGDLGYIDEDGYIFLKGRLRRVIVRWGFKISAYTIEDTISKLPEVSECVAVQVNDPDDEHAPMAFVVLAEPEKADQDAVKALIIKHCTEELKSYEVPKHVVIMDKLPYTGNNKYDFKLLEKIGNEYVASL